MSWDAYHRRQDALRETLAVADRAVTGRGALPAVDADLLLDVQMHWFQRLSGALDRSWERGPADPTTLAVRAWRHAAADCRGARALLDAHEDHPALAKAQSKELGLLAHAAGRAPLHHPDGPRIGAALRAEARTIRIEDAPSAGRRRGLRRRLQEALGA